MDFLMQAISFINDRCLGYMLMFALLAAGIYFTVVTRFVQFFWPRTIFNLLKSGKSNKGNISAFQAFAISTASRVGTGNIAGVALAITLGGPGAIFWMWLIAVFGAASSFVESTLAQIYKVPASGHFRGGPAYYMQYALGMRKLAVAFSVIITLTFAFTFNSVQ
jgi:AGCS family alanine or glycine:cation symporter